MVSTLKEKEEAKDFLNSERNIRYYPAYNNSVTSSHLFAQLGFNFGLIIAKRRALKNRFLAKKKLTWLAVMYTRGSSEYFELFSFMFTYARYITILHLYFQILTPIHYNT